MSVGDTEDQEDLPHELTLHPDPLTPEELLCTSANVVEVHRDLQTGKENVFGYTKQGLPAINMHNKGYWEQMLVNQPLNGIYIYFIH